MNGLRMKYFVLNPTSSDHHHAAASRKAMLAYAKAIQHHDYDLAVDIERWVLASQREQREKVEE